MSFPPRSQVRVWTRRWVLPTCHRQPQPRDAQTAPLSSVPLSSQPPCLAIPCMEGVFSSQGTGSPFFSPKGTSVFVIITKMIVTENQMQGFCPEVCQGGVGAG